MEIPFDGILTLLIFLVGIPAIVLQLISATERRTVLKNKRLDVTSSLSVAVVVLIIGLSIQFWFAGFSEEGGLNASTAKQIEQAIWLVIFSVLFAFALYVAKQVPEQYGQREKIIEKLTSEIIRDAMIKMRVAGGKFSDLSNLGKHCDPGQEREMVVNAFQKITKTVLVDDRYIGASFEVLIEDMVYMLTADPSPADLTSYDVAVETFSAILATSFSAERDEDIQRAVHAVSKLDQTLLIQFKSVERDHILLKSIDAMELALVKDDMLTEISQAVFEIGSCALDEKQDFVYAAALDKLTAIAANRGSLPVEFVADVCGLISRYWVMAGSRRNFAHSKFDEVKKYLPRNYLTLLKSARDHLIQTMYFTEADNLTAMIKELQKRPKSKK